MIKYSAKEKELLFWVTTPSGDINKVIREDLIYI
jgi:hypothetical protein